MRHLFTSLPKYLIVLLSFLLVGAIGLLDYGVGGGVSFSVFYMLPIAIAAWWGGGPHGLLVALSSAGVWHLLELAQEPAMPPAVRVWNAVVRFASFALTSGLVSRLHGAMARERRLARTDLLTGVANGRTFFEAAGLELGRMARNLRPLTLAYVDLDNFKTVNDRLGHSAGDELLRQVGQTLRRHTRAHDVVARLGGDEFVLLFPETDAIGGAASLAKLHEALLAGFAGKGWPVTCSIGAVTFTEVPGDVDALIQQVDNVMYRAKRAGKNRVQHETLPYPLMTRPAEAPAERRGTERRPCDLAARVRHLGKPDDRGWPATVRDLSAHGLGLQLEHRLRDQTLVTVELLADAPRRTLLARIVHASRVGHAWHHGCELALTLGDQELREWLEQGPSDFSRRPPAGSAGPRVESLEAAAPCGLGDGA